MSFRNYRPFVISERKTANHLTTTVSLLVAAISLCSVGAHAAAQEDTFILEEIVVTAQKRAQNLQDVPIAITAVSGDQIVEAAIQDIFDLQTNTPGLRVKQQNNANDTSFSIRGIGSEQANFGVESSVGLYVDGVYRSRQSSMINDMIDMQAVEILRGPQGTLFGKNTAAGAVHFRTKAPSHEADNFASITAGNQGMLNTSAAGNLSIIDDTLALRGTVFSSQRDGYIDAVGFGDDAINDRDRWGTRLQALITPTDDLSIRVIADYAKIDEVCCGAVVVKDNLTVANGLPGSDYLLELLGGTIVAGNSSDSFSTSLNALPESSSIDRGLSTEVNWDLGEYAFTSVSSYRQFESSTYGDSDFSDVELFNTGADAKLDYVSQEFRLDYSTDKMNALVGAYYFQQELDMTYQLDIGDKLQDFILIGEGLSEFQGGLDALGLGQAFAPGMQGTHRAQQDSTSWALFGQLDYNLSEALVLTAGLRYTHEDKDLSTVFSQNINGVLLDGPAYTTADISLAGDELSALGNGDFSNFGSADYNAKMAPFANDGWGQYLFTSLTPRPDLHEKLSDEQISGTLKLSWLMTEDTMVYGSYGTGYKSGGLNTDRISVGVPASFNAETTESLEVGIKTEFPEQALRINVAAHLTRMDDFQASAYDGTSFILRNAGKRTASGLELELFWQPAQDTEFSLAYAYINNEFKEFEGAACWVATPAHTGVADPSQDANGFCDRSGEGDPNHFATLGLKQSFLLADGIESYVFGEYSYTTELDRSRDPLKARAGHGLLNLRAGAYFEDAQINLTLWGRNVLGEEYLAGDTIDAPIQDGKLLGFAGAPATYGITLNKDF